ncbi:glycosyltransferase [Rhodococcus sp. NPDC059969]|uniref:glycosyltransferase n=1 Tax=Rhodococcus sp. NPDC059969 TaxID=3347018 RepID=UPI00366BBA95
MHTGQSVTLDEKFRGTVSMSSSKYSMYLAVIPTYRNPCIEVLREMENDDLCILASDYGLDPTVRTGIDKDFYERVRRIGIFGDKVLLQVGSWRNPLTASVTILDLNPRSLTAWGILALRRIMRRRTLVWGHLHPREGSSSKTAFLRRTMRRLSQGTILYGYASVVPARREIPHQPVWVAPNSLYKRAYINAENVTESRKSIVYVGRLVAEKNVDQLVPAFHRSGLKDKGAVLEIVGFGNASETIERQISDFGLEESVVLHGRIESPVELAEIYARSIMSVSPGYVGLSVTQSLGFGVPMLYPEDAPHAPEIELAVVGPMQSYSPTTEESLAVALRDYFLYLDSNPVSAGEISTKVGELYSAESMASGISAALRGQVVEFDKDGWPKEMVAR